jgi:hypothetical protein
MMIAAGRRRQLEGGAGEVTTEAAVQDREPEVG